MPTGTTEDMTPPPIEGYRNAESSRPEGKREAPERVAGREDKKGNLHAGKRRREATH